MPTPALLFDTGALIDIYRGKTLLRSRFQEHFNSLSLESSAARLAGEWMQRYEPQGLGWMDALIAATAKQAKLPVLTRDKRMAQVLASEGELEVYAVE